MSVDQRHPTEELPAFALGALDERERSAIAKHVESCARCTDDVAAFEEALYEAAAVDAVRAEPPRDLRTRIVLRHRGARGAPALDWSTRIRGWLVRPVPLAVPLALAVVLVVSFAALGVARRDLDEYERALAGITDGRVVAMAPQQGAAGARGSVVLPRAGTPYVVLRLDSPPAGKTWEAWVIKGDRPEPAGLNGSGGVFTITLTAPVGPGDVIAVTLEPGVGSLAPTTQPVLVGAT
jgi:anti-sigma factor RsiW